MQCIILAGGVGSRLGKLTESTPKPLIDIEGHPFLYYQLLDLARQGIHDVILSIGYLGDQIKNYVGDGGRWGIRVRYVDEGKDLKGTGGALRLVADQINVEEKFFVVYGDSFLKIDYKDAFLKFKDSSESPEEPRVGKNKMLMAVLKNNGQWDQSNCVVSDGSSDDGVNAKVTLYDKWIQPKPSDMVYVDYGLSILEKSVVRDFIPANEKYDLGKLAHQLSVQSLVQAYIVTERFYEIGSVQGLEDFRSLVRSGFFAEW